MRVLPAITVTDAMLVSSTVPETDYAAWNSGTNYVAGALVRYVDTNVHLTFECIANNSNKNPLTDANASDFWTEVGQTNRWAMFDLLRNTGTASDDPITVVLQPGQRVDSVALVGMKADTVSIELRVDGNLKYSYSENLRRRSTASWSDYFFGTFETKEETARFDLPPYTNGEITLTFSATSGGVVVGGVLMGRSTYIGETQYSPTSDALNFSSVDRDLGGKAEMVRRRSIPKTTQRVRAPKALVPKLLALRDQLNAVPALWSGLDDAEHSYFGALLILGFYRQFTISMEHADYAYITLELEEV